MTQTYADYAAISISALEFNPKYREVVSKKQEILAAIEQHHRRIPDSILFYGFSPLLLATALKNIYVTAINDQVKNLLDANQVKYTYIAQEQISDHKKKFDWVIVDSNQHRLIVDLETAGFTVIPLQMRHSRTLGGGFHCVTLDLIRE